MFAWLLNKFRTKPLRASLCAPVGRFLRGRYDAAVTHDGNYRHWAGADGLSANAAANPEVRRILRNRARYEVANNSYARGIVRTLANDVVGTGPQLQMLTNEPETNRRIEREFAGWSAAVQLPEKLRTMRMAQAEDGESFAILTNNPRVDSPVKLDLRLVEAEQVTTPDNGEADLVEPMDTINLEARALLTMPGGWKMGQIRAEQPATTYGEFKREILNEIARCLNMPFNVAAGNSSGYNYASGRLDHQTYFKSIGVDQSHIDLVVMNRILAAWLIEAVLVTDLLPLWMRGVPVPDHQWFWNGREHVDPAKEANAQATRLKSNTTTLAHEYAKQGRDWETELRQRAKEQTLIEELGLSETTTA